MTGADHGDGTRVIYLSACDWSAPWHGPQEIAARLGADGYRVAYVETLGRRRPRLADLGRMARRVRGAANGLVAAGEPSPGVTIVAPLVIPGARWRPEHAINRTLVARALRQTRREGSPSILWVYTPSVLAVNLVRRVPADLIIYHCTQSHRHRPAAPRGTQALESAIMDAADLVVTDGIELYRERLPRHPRVVRIPSGVNPWDATHVREPQWAAGLARPRIGYLGSVDHRIDVGLLEALARAHPEWPLVLVGPIDDAAVGPLRRLPNVHFRPQISIAEVPAALSAFDVGLMPYADIPMTRYTYPAKLHPYLAAGLPIATTPLPDLEEFGNLVETGTGAAGFVAAVERAVSRPRRSDLRRSVARRNTWSSRYSDLHEAIGEAWTEKARVQR